MTEIILCIKLQYSEKKNPYILHCLEGSSFEYFCLSDIKITDVADRGQLTKLNPFKPINFFHLPRILVDRIFRILSLLNVDRLILRMRYKGLPDAM